MYIRTTARHIAFSILGYLIFSVPTLLYVLFFVMWFLSYSFFFGFLIFCGGIWLMYELTKKVLFKFSPKKETEISAGELSGIFILVSAFFVLFFDSLLNDALIYFSLLDLFAIPLAVAGVRMYKFFHNC